MTEKVGVFNPEEAQRMMQARNSEEKANVALVEEVRQQSIQLHATETGGSVGAGHDVSAIVRQSVSFFYQSGDILPSWWSPSRDRALSEFWKSCSVLSGAMYAMASKMATIPWHIEPRDHGLSSHWEDARRYEENLMDSAEMQMQSLLGQDNGRFMEVIDMADSKLGPLQPPALSVAHLDPSRCIRTSNPVYPVKYQDIDGKQHALHWTRVAYNSQLPSELVQMYKVGFCAVSRAASYGQNMLDMATYKEEKLGSRPLRAILVAKGFDAEALGKALEAASQMSDDAGNMRYAYTPVIGNVDIENPGIDIVSLSSLPDGFDEETWTYIAMAAIALAFGVDARELWPMQQAGATKADAVLSHIKQRGKGPGHIIAATERMFNMYFLPRHLKMVFDFQDDAQDRQHAEIQQERALARKTNIELAVTDTRVERMTMVTDGALTAAQFNDLELGDGRLPDGKPLNTLFSREEAVYVEILTLKGISNPTDVLANDIEKVLKAISTQRSAGLRILAGAGGEIKKRQAKEALAALDSLEEEYKLAYMPPPKGKEDIQSQSSPDPQSRQRQTARGAPDANDSERSVTTPSYEESMVRESDETKALIEIVDPKENNMRGIFRKRYRSSDSKQLLLEAFEDFIADADKEPIIVNVAIPPQPPINVEVKVPEQPAPVVNVTLPEQEKELPPIEVTANIPTQELKEAVEESVKEALKNSQVETMEVQRNERGEISAIKRTRGSG
jgi:hypothetical protein